MPQKPKKKKKKIEKIDRSKLDYEHTGTKGEFLLQIAVIKILNKLEEIIDYLNAKKT